MGAIRTEPRVKDVVCSIGSRHVPGCDVNYEERPGKAETGRGAVPVHGVGDDAGRGLPCPFPSSQLGGRQFVPGGGKRRRVDQDLFGAAVGVEPPQAEHRIITGLGTQEQHLVARDHGQVPGQPHGESPGLGVDLWKRLRPAGGRWPRI